MCNLVNINFIYFRYQSFYNQLIILLICTNYHSKILLKKIKNKNKEKNVERDSLFRMLKKTQLIGIAPIIKLEFVRNAHLKII